MSCLEIHEYDGPQEKINRYWPKLLGEIKPCRLNIQDRVLAVAWAWRKKTRGGSWMRGKRVATRFFRVSWNEQASRYTLNDARTFFIPRYLSKLAGTRFAVENLVAPIFQSRFFITSRWFFFLQKYIPLLISHFSKYRIIIDKKKVQLSIVIAL